MSAFAAASVASQALGGAFGVLGSIAQSRALSAQADLERQAAQARLEFQRQEGSQALRRNQLLTLEVEGRLAAAAAARGLSGTSGSVEDLQRANAISGALNRATINANIQRGAFETSMDFAARLQGIRNRRSQARLSAVGSVLGAASGITRTIASELDQ